MAKKMDPRLLEILQQYGENPEEALWDCHGTWVAYHKAIERIATRAGVSYADPKVLVAQRDAAAILVTGNLGDKVEWSIGEAAIDLNYRVSGRQAAYPFAMAEKRAKDRVVLKLIGLHGLVYSEEESDDFKPIQTATFNPDQPQGPRPGDGRSAYVKEHKAGEEKRDEDRQRRQVGWSKDGTTRTANSLKKEGVWDEFQMELRECETVAMVTKLALAWSKKVEEDKWPEHWKEQLREEMQKRRDFLKSQPAPDDDTFPGDLPSKQPVNTLGAM